MEMEPTRQGDPSRGSLSLPVFAHLVVAFRCTPTSRTPIHPSCRKTHTGWQLRKGPCLQAALPLRCPQTTRLRRPNSLQKRAVANKEFWLGRKCDERVPGSPDRRHLPHWFHLARHFQARPWPGMERGGVPRLRWGIMPRMSTCSLELGCSSRPVSLAVRRGASHSYL